SSRAYLSLTLCCQARRHSSFTTPSACPWISCKTQHATRELYSIKRVSTVPWRSSAHAPALPGKDRLSRAQIRHIRICPHPCSRATARLDQRTAKCLRSFTTARGCNNLKLVTRARSSLITLLSTLKQEDRSAIAAGSTPTITIPWLPM